MVDKLPDIINPATPGPLESVDELPSATTYYDGSLHLNVAQLDCLSAHGCDVRAGCPLSRRRPLYPCFFESRLSGHVSAAEERRLHNREQPGSFPVSEAATLAYLAVPGPDRAGPARPRGATLADVGGCTSDQLDRCHLRLGCPSGIGPAYSGTQGQVQQGRGLITIRPLGNDPRACDRGSALVR